MQAGRTWTNAMTTTELPAPDGRPPDTPAGRVLAWARDTVTAAFSRRIWTATAYLVVSPATGALWAGLVLGLLTVSVATLALAGVPLLAATLLVASALARVERRWIAATLGERIEAVASPPPPRGLGAWRWLSAVVTERSHWRDTAYLLLLLPLGLVWGTTALTMWAVSFGFAALPLLVLVPSPTFDLNVTVGPAVWTIDSPAEGLLAGILIGAPLVVLVTPAVVRLMARAHLAIARRLLGPSRAGQLAARNEALRSSRARAVTVAAAERRRIERDLHDGAQARLVSVAMRLGMAKEKFAAEPDAARELLDEAHAEAKRAIAELRDLARGIHPAVLTDRGLDAALSALAGRSPVPVEVRVRLPGRPPPELESIAYFVVAEALTNAAKHGEASAASVRVDQAGGMLVVEVGDDGRGGADPAGAGLRGLADRCAAVDGALTVVSPPGGPTTIRAELPCGP
jgi:signal transduction histidine kinase